jgi:exonuclease SbcD
MGKSRQAEHEEFLAWLIEQIEIHQVDALLVAGDIFDTGAPPSYARELYNHFAVTVSDTNTQVVVLGGNHDSVAMLGESKTLLACLGVTVIPGVSEHPTDQLLVLNSADGQPGLILCGIPFIRARDVIQSQAGQSAQEKQQSLQEAIHKHYQQIFKLAEAQRIELGIKLPIVATGHLTTVGASVSESVREIYIGSLEAFPTDAFPAADYIALGHIHRPQKVGGLEHIRYCGSPIPLSFDEINQNKEVLLVDLDTNGLKSIKSLTVPRFQELMAVRGNLADIKEKVESAVRLSRDNKPVWIEITVHSDDYLNDLQDRIHTLIEDLPVEVLRIKRERIASTSGLQQKAKETLAELSTDDVFYHRLSGESLEAELQSDLLVLYRQVVNEVQEPSL